MARAQRRGGGRQGGSGGRGATGRGQSAGRSGGRASSGRGASSGGQRGSTRGGAAAGRGTRAGASAGKSGGSPALLIGGLVVAVLVVVGIMASMSGGGGGKGTKKEKASKSSIGLAELRDQVKDEPEHKPLPLPSSSGSSTSRSKPKKLARDVKPRKPASYYQNMVDTKIWTRAKNKANEATEILSMMKRGERPAGMTEKAAKAKVRTLFGEALEIANEFLDPVEKHRDEAKHFLRRYDDIMLSWQRQMRSVVYGRNK